MNTFDGACLICGSHCHCEEDFDSKRCRYLCDGCGEHVITHPAARMIRGMNPGTKTALLQLISRHRGDEATVLLLSKPLNSAQGVPCVPGIYWILEGQERLTLCPSASRRKEL